MYRLSKQRASSMIMQDSTYRNMFTFVLIISFTAMAYADVTVIIECINITNDSSTANCRDQDLQEIPNPLSGNVIEKLDLADNRISTLSSSIFQTYHMLRELFLQRNVIEDMEEDAFVGLRYLHTVVLSENDISYISPNTFIHNPNLEVVSLQGNPLIQVPTDMPILISPSLRELDISYCSLSSVTPKTFSQVENLQTLDLTSNRLQSVSLDVFQSLPKLTIVNVPNNRFSCDCSLATLLDWITSVRSKKVAAHKPVRCYEADGFTRKMWSSAQSNIDCRSKSSTSNSQNTTNVPTTGVVAGKLSYKTATPVDKGSIVVESHEYYDTSIVNSQTRAKSSNSVSRYYIKNQATINSILVVFGMLTATILGTCLVMKCITKPHHASRNKCLNSENYVKVRKNTISTAPLIDHNSFHSQMSLSESQYHIYETVK